MWYRDNYRMFSRQVASSPLASKSQFPLHFPQSSPPLWSSVELLHVRVDSSSGRRLEGFIRPPTFCPGPDWDRLGFVMRSLCLTGKAAPHMLSSIFCVASGVYDHFLWCVLSVPVNFQFYFLQFCLLKKRLQTEDNHQVINKSNEQQPISLIDDTNTVAP